MVKKVFILNLLFLVVAGHLYSQKRDFFYKNATWTNRIDDSAFYYKDSSICLRNRIRRFINNEKFMEIIYFIQDSNLKADIRVVEHFDPARGEGKLHNGKREGIWLFKFKDSLTLKTLAEYKGGKNHGIYKAYYPNGKIKEFGNYFNNFKIGEWIELYEEGRIKSVGSYYPDTIIQVTIPTREDSIAEEGRDRPDVPFLKRTIIYLKHGEWFYYHPTGKLYLKEFYDKGTLLRKEEY